MQRQQPSPRGYDAVEDGDGQAHVAEVILCDISRMALLSRIPRPTDAAWLSYQ